MDLSEGPHRLTVVVPPSSSDGQPPPPAIDSTIADRLSRLRGMPELITNLSERVPANAR
jgi:hypothetical protein